MIDTHVFSIGKYMVFYVVSSPVVIRDLVTYADLQDNRGGLNCADFMLRIRFHKAYCYVRGHSLLDKIAILPFKRAQARSGLWIDFDGFVEAHVIAHPEEIFQTIPDLSLEDAIEIVEDNEWLEIFDVDGDDVIGVLQKEASALCS